jgi:hypothetical protein
MLYTLKKTAVIGLGGTGLKAVLYMKRKLKQTFGKIPPMIKFLVIDTTDKEDLISETGTTVLEKGEFLKLEVRNPASLIRTNAEVRKWIPEKVPRFALTSGAKQVRPLGRLAVFANASELEAKIDGLINSIKDYTIERDDKYEIISDKIYVNLVCSLSGGTGSGCFLDVAALIKKDGNLGQTDKLVCYFLLPDIFAGKPATRNVEPNAYGALKEISWFYTNDAYYSYTLGGRERSVSSGLFDAIYLVNNTNRQGVKYNEVDDLNEFLGMGMFLQSSSTGKKAGDIIDNLESQFVGQNWFGKPTVFSSFGISEIVYPGDWYSNLLAKRIVLNVIQKGMIGGDMSGVDKFTSDFVQRVGIKEHEADDVINSILQPGDFKKFALPPSFKKEVITSTIAKRESHLIDTERYFVETARKNLASFKSEKTKTLSEEVDDLLSRPNGIEFCRHFLLALADQLLMFKEEMTKERDEYTKVRKDLKPRYDLVKADIDRAAKSLLGISTKIEIELKKFKELVDRESQLVLEIQRRERAAEFFSYLTDIAQKLVERIEALSSILDVIVKELNQDIARMEIGRKEIKPFVEEVKPPGLIASLPDIDPRDFLKWLADVEQSNLRKLSEKRVEQVKSILFKYAHSQEVIREIETKTIESVLKELSVDEQNKYIALLDKMASPLWQYDQGLISGDKRTENIYLFGVENRDETIFEEERLKANIATPFPPAVISTGDSKRVICLKIEAPLPAFVVSNMPRYREKYLDPQRPFSYHIHKEWEDLLPDLFPGAEEAESRKYWSLALAEPFNLITKIGEFYYIKSEKSGERTRGFKVKLAQGRGEAMKAFLDNEELIKETKEAIEAITEKTGTEKVAEALRGYGTSLEARASRQTEEIRKQIELELSDIESYMLALSRL